MKVVSLEQSVLLTIKYFDALNYAPTFFEIWKHTFYHRVRLENIIEMLDQMIKEGKVEMKNGFYFLPEKSNLVDLRQEKYDTSEKLWRKAVRAIRVLNCLPFIKSIAVANTLSFFNCDKSSDIDLFIITEKDKIWTARFLTTALSSIIGIKRKEGKVAQRLCLSFYISEEKMGLEYLTNSLEKQFYAFWMSQFAIVADHSDTFKKFIEQNQWIGKTYPNFSFPLTDYHTKFKDLPFARITRGGFRILLGSKKIELWLKKLQLKKISASQKKLGDPKSVIFNDHALKFHIQEFKREKESGFYDFFLREKRKYQPQSYYFDKEN